MAGPAHNHGAIFVVKPRARSWAICPPELDDYHKAGIMENIRSQLQDLVDDSDCIPPQDALFRSTFHCPVNFAFSDNDRFKGQAVASFLITAITRKGNAMVDFIKIQLIHPHGVRPDKWLAPEGIQQIPP